MSFCPCQEATVFGQVDADMVVLRINISVNRMIERMVFITVTSAVGSPSVLFSAVNAAA